jgi:hypothetical protein
LLILKKGFSLRLLAPNRFIANIKKVFFFFAYDFLRRTVVVPPTTAGFPSAGLAFGDPTLDFGLPIVGVAGGTEPWPPKGWGVFKFIL